MRQISLPCVSTPADIFLVFHPLLNCLKCIIYEDCYNFLNNSNLHLTLQNIRKHVSETSAKKPRPLFSRSPELLYAFICFYILYLIYFFTSSGGFCFCISLVAASSSCISSSRVSSRSSSTVSSGRSKLSSSISTSSPAT